MIECKYCVHYVMDIDFDVFCDIKSVVKPLEQKDTCELYIDDFPFVDSFERELINFFQK